ncbi:MAG TPA: lipid IV(A) 3-deoxy-D-manno-octulosonic acid transferase [Acidiferrobacterales bacterium]|nr:lipid IV(A) 3-deoxy-D-manno-octulosonic acid transferase [Acidiferrobacterales bacterium]
MAIVLYSLILYLLIPFVLTRLMWRGVRQRGYWWRWSERFGFVPRLQGPVIWLHAVSVGEVRASAPLVKALSRDYPGNTILITTMTPTGSATVRELFGDSVAHCYVPYDLPTAVWRFLNRTRPRLALIIETELWPNLFHQCHKRGIPLILANVRMSEKSARGYRRFAGLTRATLADVSRVGAQTEADAERIRALGAAQVEVTGSIKFEMDVPADLAARTAVLRSGIGNRPVWVAASTRIGEEEYVLDAFARLRERIPRLLLVLVPRHPERFDTVAKLCHQRGYRIERRSERKDGVAPDTAILLGDTMGEMLLFHAAADVSYIGGSLVPLGGQNLLEAAAVGTPVVFGPHMFNFSEISRMALERGAGRQVQDAAELTSAVAGYVENPAMRKAAGEAGQRMVAENRGALAKTLVLVRQALTP